MFSFTSLRKVIEMRGAANLDWTDAGMIAGNDYFHPFCYDLKRKRRLMPSRHYKPIWVLEAEEMQSELDVTRNRRLRESAEWATMERAIYSNAKTTIPLDIFGVEWAD